ncbi:MAG: hypothetical protein JXR48_16745 [Candidatus Delongbacteria bacterium]|nr:hypothetical protein [Candidatus Delongbacteria bacterium]MBN2836606.1 hypothetical protein [Candidatus Delongbacteria bacterium]
MFRINPRIIIVLCFFLPSSIFGKELSLSDSLQIKAYFNYYNLFPNDQKTPEYLFNAALIYHNNLFYDSNDTVLRTIIENYKGTKEEVLSYKMLYEEKIELKQYQEAEKIIKSMGDLTNLSDDDKLYVANGNFDSIIKQAKECEDKADSKSCLEISAELYLRAALENPKNSNSPNSIWISSRLFGEAKNWDRMFYSLETLVEKYPNYRDNEGVDLIALSKNLISYLYSDTLPKYNSSYDGFRKADLKEYYLTGAKHLESFYKEYQSFIFNDSDLSRINLSNAAYYYKLAENYKKSIEMNELYIAKYGKAEDKNNNMIRYNEIANLYRKEGQHNKVIETYAEIGEKFKGTVFSLKSYYERAKRFQQAGDTDKLINEYKNVIKSYELLKEEKDKNSVLYMVSEALLYLTELDRISYNRIDLSDVKTTKELNEKLKLKEQKLNELKTKYEIIISYSQKEYVEAQYHLAQIFEEFAVKRYQQKRFQTKNIIDDLANENAVSSDALNFYRIAINQYITEMDNIDEFRKTWGVFLEENIREIERLIAENPDNFEFKDIKDRLINDDTIEKAEEIQIKSRASILKTQYDLANINKSLALKYMNLTKDDLGKKEYSIEYYDEIDLIVEQSAFQLIDDYRSELEKFLIYSKKYDIEDSELYEIVLQELNETDKIATNFYFGIINSLNRDLKSQNEKIETLSKYRVNLDKDGYIIPSSVKLDRWRPFYTVHENIELYLEYINNFSNKIATHLSNLLHKNYAFDKHKSVETYTEALMELKEEIKPLISYFIENQERLNSDFTKNPKFQQMYYETAEEFMNSYEQYSKMIKNIIAELFETAYNNTKDLEIDDNAYNIILFELINSRAFDYYEELGLKTENLKIGTDLDWYVINEEVENWNRLNTDYRMWQKPVLSEISVEIQNDSLIDKSITKFIDIDSDELKVNFFRKDFEINNIITNGKLFVCGDEKIAIIINGKILFDMIFKEVPDDYSDYFDLNHNDWNAIRKINITDYLIKGKNYMLIINLDTDNTSNGIIGEIEIEVISEKISPDFNFLERIKSLRVEELDDYQKENFRLYKKKQR